MFQSSSEVEGERTGKIGGGIEFVDCRVKGHGRGKEAAYLQEILL